MLRYSFAQCENLSYICRREFHSSFPLMSHALQFLVWEILPRSFFYCTDHKFKNMDAPEKLAEYLFRPISSSLTSAISRTTSNLSATLLQMHLWLLSHSVLLLSNLFFLPQIIRYHFIFVCSSHHYFQGSTFHMILIQFAIFSQHHYFTKGLHRAQPV